MMNMLFAPAKCSTWNTLPCEWCRKPLNTPVASQRLCPDCRGDLYEGLAARIEPSYDPSRLNEWSQCEAVLARLWGTDWPVPEPKRGS